MLTGELIKAARALLRADQRTLAQSSGLSVATIKRLELVEGPIGGRASTEDALRRALEEAGLIFIEEDGQGVGLRLRSERSSS